LEGLDDGISSPEDSPSPKGNLLSERDNLLDDGRTDGPSGTTGQSYNSIQLRDISPIVAHSAFGGASHTPTYTPKSNNASGNLPRLQGIVDQWNSPYKRTKSPEPRDSDGEV
jgi:hypothetical protein